MSVPSVRTVVVLPAPLGPRNPNTSPRPTSNDTPSNATRSPNRLSNPLGGQYGRGRFVFFFRRSRPSSDSLGPWDAGLDRLATERGSAALLLAAGPRGMIPEPRAGQEAPIRGRATGRPIPVRVGPAVPVELPGMADLLIRSRSMSGPAAPRCGGCRRTDELPRGSRSSSDRRIVGADPLNPNPVDRARRSSRWRGRGDLLHAPQVFRQPAAWPTE